LVWLSACGALLSLVPALGSAQRLWRFAQLGVPAAASHTWVLHLRRGAQLGSALVALRSAWCSAWLGSALVALRSARSSAQLGSTLVALRSARCARGGVTHLGASLARGLSSAQRLWRFTQLGVALGLAQRLRRFAQLGLALGSALRLWRFAQLDVPMAASHTWVLHSQGGLSSAQHLRCFAQLDVPLAMPHAWVLHSRGGGSVLSQASMRCWAGLGWALLGVRSALLSRHASCGA